LPIVELVPVELGATVLRPCGNEGVGTAAEGMAEVFVLPGVFRYSERDLSYLSYAASTPS